ncbi:hypothetical protein QE380_002463 [Acinetobacter baylyi]|uniref:Lipoprotein n=1 Tax=Acinetobacter baylyi TaxID=202950 RepID=A0ABU0UYA1_ACIBI|nr:hypothetical protein [Acinetobacter baylyi]MDQ1209540.1 hypothetical protein [Acinetobacter baylyi]MDR6106865.1 hypothetical protein [Acinetobacter baylyi]MDR6186413.1 hypothetical protein [Acinetobacter baylyi]
MDFLLNKSIKVLNIKPYIFITIIFPVLLVGCGGGSSSDTQTSTNQSDPVQSTENVTGTYYTVDSEDLSYREIKLVNNVSPNTDYSTRLSSDEYLLTETNLYTNTWVKADFRAINSTKFYFSDAPGVGYYQTIKAVDVSGEDVFDRVFPGYRIFYKSMPESYINKESYAYQLYTRDLKQTFPKGSICYQIVDQTPIKPHITFNSENITEDSYVDKIEEYIADFNENSGAIKDGYTHSIISGNWGGRDWKYLKAFDKNGLIDDEVLLNYNGKIVHAQMNNYEEMNVNQIIKEMTARMKDNPKAMPLYELYLASLSSECKWFNEPAFNAVLQLKKN